MEYDGAEGAYVQMQTEQASHRIVFVWMAHNLRADSLHIIIPSVVIIFISNPFNRPPPIGLQKKPANFNKLNPYGYPSG